MYSIWSNTFEVYHSLIYLFKLKVTRKTFVNKNPGTETIWVYTNVGAEDRILTWF